MWLSRASGRRWWISSWKCRRRCLTGAKFPADLWDELVSRSGQDLKPEPEFAAHSGTDNRGLDGQGCFTNYGGHFRGKKNCTSRTNSGENVRTQRDLEPKLDIAAKSRAGLCRGRQNLTSGADFWTNGYTDRGYRSAQDLAPGKCGGSQTTSQERIYERSQVSEVPKILCRGSAEVAKSICQERTSERFSERSRVQCPKTHARKVSWVVKSVPQERSPEWMCERSEVNKVTSSQDQIWQCGMSMSLLHDSLRGFVSG